MELDEHIKALDNFGLRSAGWLVEPLKNVENDYVSELCNNYLKDLEQRKLAQMSPDAQFSGFLRKTVKMDEVQNVVTHQYKKIGGLKSKNEEKQAELEAAKKKNEHIKKINIMCNQRIEFKKDKALKRQNSHTPILDEFGEFEDQVTLQREMEPIRRSFKRKRKGINQVVKDCTKARLELEYQSDAGSVGSVNKNKFQSFSPPG